MLSIQIGKILDFVPRTASLEEYANRIVLRPVWPPRTKKCNNDNNPEHLVCKTSHNNNTYSVHIYNGSSKRSLSRVTGGL
jgi:hypothetical protein